MGIMTDTQEVIRVSAVVYKVQTLVDGGLRVTLDLPETAIGEASRLMECKRGGAVLEIAAVPVLQIGTGQSGKISEGPVGKSEWSSPQE